MAILEDRRRTYKKIEYENLTFEILTTGTLTWRKKNNSNKALSSGIILEYRKNSGTWSNMTVTTTLSVVLGDIVEFRRDNHMTPFSTYNGDVNVTYHHFGGTATFNLRGHLCSIVGGGNHLPSDTESGSKYFLERIFKESKVVSAKYLILANNTCAYCYLYLFYGCSLLNEAPVLPATTLAIWCYCSMFYGCTSLIKAPDLPATTLVTQCYRYMFKNCSNLNYIKVKCKALGGNSYEWVNNVASSGTFVRTVSFSSTRGISAIPSGWTIVKVSS